MRLAIALLLLALVGSCDYDNTGQYEIRDGMLCTVPTATEGADYGISATTCEVLP